MTSTRSALVIDDDQNVLNIMAYHLRRRFKSLRVECRLEPVVDGDFDIYFLDNDFNGRPLAAELAETIRAQHPDSLIIAFSAMLDSGALKRLINCGCTGAFSKGSPDEFERMLQIVSHYLSAPDANKSSAQDGTGVVATVRSISGLIHEWNQRLSDHKHTIAKG